MPTTDKEAVINVTEIEPQLKHETVFQAYDQLKEGKSFIIHNDHDPKPLYYQLQVKHGDTFTWEYIQKGPEAWDIRITKKEVTKVAVEKAVEKAKEVKSHYETMKTEAVTTNDAGDIVLDVPKIDGKYKHEIIFKTFEELEVGKKMIIHNDHDPIPVYYQLQKMHGEIFDWDYLQDGPEEWDIEVTKNEATTKKTTTVEQAEIVINVPDLEPSIKHSTILQTYDQLTPGKSMMIHNDHDPKPLFYQLQQLHGEEAFTWEYIQKGPEWWDIRVTKKGTAEEPKKEVKIKTVLNVPQLAPAVKHQTIFQTFDDLQPGEAMLIHNDHDPKPLHYQLNEMHGSDSFDWEYVQEGPTWWDVKITKIHLDEEEDTTDDETEAISKKYNGAKVINVPTIESHQLKHETIFKAYEASKIGESFIIHNDHDPVPVYYQMRQMHGQVFTWSYLHDGPDYWDIQVTKNSEDVKKEAEEHDDHKDKVTIDVAKLAPQVRHETILGTYEELKPGESMLVHANHDPKPLFYQLKHDHGEVFSWDYKKEGPDFWDVRITKDQEDQHQDETVASVKGEVVINVPDLAPEVKHETILVEFEALEPGESMIIHNNHDPKPVYFQMKDLYGDVFSWDYLKEGPEWWDIRVRRNKEDIASDIEPINEKDRVVNVPDLPAAEKHPTIFKVFEEIQPGESMVIHNDHDPKPLYYQLLGEKGDIFEWKYLQEGPEWWDIRITKKVFNDSETIGEIAASDWRKARVFQKFGIDFANNGKETLGKTCAEEGLDAEKINHELQEAAKDNSRTAGDYRNYNEWNLDFMIDYIINTHHTYSRATLTELKKYAAKVLEVHGKDHPELEQIKASVERIADGFTEHLDLEENHLFPLIKKIIKGEKATAEGKNLDAWVNENEQQHAMAGQGLRQIRELSHDYKLPSDACASYGLLFKMIQEFEKDLQIHIHLENNILFPKALQLEGKL